MRTKGREVKYLAYLSVLTLWVAPMEEASKDILGFESSVRKTLVLDLRVKSSRPVYVWKLY